MKGNFSFQRLKLLVKKEVAENKYIYISLLCSFSAIAIVSCLCVGFLGKKMGNDIENHQQCALLLSVFVGIFDVMLVALPAILGYTSVRRLCFDKTRCFYMLLPANNSEKIISVLLVNFIVFPIVLFLTMVCLCAFCIISFNMNPFETIYTNMLIASKSEIVCYLAFPTSRSEDITPCHVNTRVEPCTLRVAISIGKLAVIKLVVLEIVISCIKIEI